MVRFANAQTEAPCGSIDGSAGYIYSPVSPNTPCINFNVNDVIANCTPIYIRLNFHLFVGNDCNGSFDVNNLGANWPQEAAYFEDNQFAGNGVAERMVFEMNQKLANNQGQELPNGQIAQPACNPLRFVLGDVQIHCDFPFRTQQSWTSYQNKYGQFAPSGINVYYSKHCCGASGEGQLYGPGVLISSLDAGLLLHEIGHNLSLQHTFGDDGCNDTPNEGVNWDQNCDHDFLDFHEMNWPCYSVLPPDDAWCTNVACAYQNSPCCNPNNVYNNVMGYNSTRTSLTPCQTSKMITALTQYPCTIVSQVGSPQCPPPAAILAFLPLEMTTDDCMFCLQGGASMNDVKNRLRIVKLPGNTLVHDTGWLLGKAGTYCFDLHSGPTGILLPNTQYKATLSVQNACGIQSVKNLTFKTPNFPCQIQQPNKDYALKVVPNPGSSTVEISYTLDQESPVWVYVQKIDQSSMVLLYQNATQPIGDATLSINAASWATGQYDIQLRTSSGINHFSFVKI